MSKKRYSAEFKKEATRLMIMDGLSAAEVSAELGVNQTMLYRWKDEQLKKLEKENEPKEATPSEMAAEIVKLRKELAKQKRMNEILKKTVGYFAKDEP